MNSKILSGSKILILSSREDIRAEVYATLSIEEWSADIHFPESFDLFKKELLGEEASCLLVIAEPAADMAEQYFGQAKSLGLGREQIIFGCVRDSLAHRIIARNCQNIFPLSIKTTPLGPRIEIDALPSALLTAWKEHISLQLDNEIKTAATHGSLALIASTQSSPEPGKLKERAHIAFALSNHINGSPSFRSRVIKCALYSDIIHLQDWLGIAKNWRNIWPIIDLLEAKHRWTESRSTVWPAEMPIELAIVETAILAQVQLPKGDKSFSDELKTLSSALPLELRTNLRLSAQSILKRAWGSQRNAA